MRITTTEIEDFHEIIIDAGLEPGDFELIEQYIHLPRPARESDAGRGLGKCQRTGRERYYSVLHWVVDFADDLRDGAFD